MEYGFVRVAAAIPSVRVADVKYNLEQIKLQIVEAESKGVQAVVFPELCITGYSCQDLFTQRLIIEESERAIEDLLDFSRNKNIAIVVGIPVDTGKILLNCATVICNGRLDTSVPKTYLPNYGEFYEKRWFASAQDINEGEVISYAGLHIELTRKPILFQLNDGTRFGVEICEDVWAPAPPSNHLALAGADIIFNLSASDELIGKHNYLKSLLAQQSARTISAYVYSSCGFGESTQDVVYGGNALIYENGKLMAEAKRFSMEPQMMIADVDVEMLRAERRRNTTFVNAQRSEHTDKVFCLDINDAEAKDDVATLQYRDVDAHPFIPKTENMSNSCDEIFNIQVAGLAKRLEATRSKRAVIGLSGGLDSTLALLVVAETFRLLDRPAKEILALTMPGFGTTHRTRNNAVELAKLLGVELRTVDIQKACLQHFADIGHDPQKLDVTYENVQARERTQILMDIANSEGGIVIGTGDLSEIALGWSTYNADHMSMYAVNCDIPKTLVRHIVSWYADRAVHNPSETGTELSLILKDILDTPVSPELLPADSSGQIAQKTESILGAYELHDFFLYHFAKYGAAPEKLRYLAKYAFANRHADEEIDKALTIFIRRFFTQQFKRSCIPDGPKVGTISLSPRADWRMPSDASSGDWFKEV